MMAILSLLGVGGIGAALFFIPGLLPRLIAVLRGIPWFAFVIAALIAAVFIQHRIYARSVTKYATQIAKIDAAWKAETAAHNVTKVSLTLVRGEIDAQNAAIDAMGKASVAAKARSDAALAAAQRDAGRHRTVVTQLQHIAPVGPCKTPDAVTKALEAL